MIEISCTEEDIETFLCSNNNLEKYLNLRFLKRQVKTPVGIIDIIAYNNSTKRFVIIELKKDTLDYKAFFQLERYRSFVEKDEYLRQENKEVARWSLGIKTPPIKRTFDYLLIGRHLSPDLRYSVEFWDEDSDIHYARAWYRLFSYSFDTKISFNYYSKNQRIIENTTYIKEGK